MTPILYIVDGASGIVSQVCDTRADASFCFFQNWKPTKFCQCPCKVSVVVYPDSTIIVSPRQPSDFASQQGSRITTTSGELCNALHHSHWLGMYSSNKTGVTITPQRKTSNLTEQFSASPSPTSDFASMQDSHIGRTATGLCFDIQYIVNGYDQMETSWSLIVTTDWRVSEPDRTISLYLQVRPQNMHHSYTAHFHYIRGLSVRTVWRPTSAWLAGDDVFKKRHCSREAF